MARRDTLNFEVDGAVIKVDDLAIRQALGVAGKDPRGAIAFKFALTLFVIVACEIIARVRPLTAWLLIWFGVLISAFPPVWSIGLLIIHHTSPV